MQLAWGRVGSPKRPVIRDFADGEHGEVTAMVGGLGVGYITRHADATVLATTHGTNQRKPYRFEPSRDGDALRSYERGDRGERARAAVDWAGFDVVDHDRRGRQRGFMVPPAEAAEIVEQVRQQVAAGSGVEDALDTVARGCGWSVRTVQRLWRARAQGPAPGPTDR